MTAISVGLIGAGYWGSNLARVLEESTEFKLLCVADTAPDRGNCSVDDLLGRDDIDAIVIATPATTHADLVTAALSADKHVLVEKPLALSTEDAEFCCDLADEQRRRLMVDLTYVYSPGFAAVRRVLDELGEPISVQSVRTHDGGPGDVNSLWDLLPHDLSICQAVAPWWWGAPPLTVRVIGDGEAGLAWFGWPEGRRCVVDFSRSSNDKVRHVSVTTADGARVRWVDHPVPRVFLEAATHDSIIEVPVDDSESLRNMVDAFAQTVRSGEPAPTSGRSTITAIAAIEQADGQVRP